MRKVFGLVVAIVGLLPFVVSAKDEIEYKCAEDGDVFNCTVSVILEEPAYQLTMYLTEENGAEITNIEKASDEWNFDVTENNSVYTLNLDTFNLESVKGEYDLIKFTYVGSEAPKLNFAGEDITPDIPNSTTDNKDTGATLPYIALSVVALGAAAAYVLTKNKSKVYKI